MTQRKLVPREQLQDEDSELFELVPAERPRTRRIEGIVVGRLTEVGPDDVHVDFPDNESAQPIAARSTVALDRTSSGREVALAFEQGDPERPIVLGLLHLPSPKRIAPVSETDVRVDGERVVFEARHEVVLRCGKASITLSGDGKVRIRGADVLSRSSGRHRIKGGSVSIN